MERQTQILTSAHYKIYRGGANPDKFNSAVVPPLRSDSSPITKYSSARCIHCAIRAEGKDKQIDQKMAETLLAKSDSKPAKWMIKDKKITWLAFNRRDLILEPTGQQSAKIYPADAPDARIIWQRHEPPLKRVEMLSKATPKSVQQATASNSGN